MLAGWEGRPQTASLLELAEQLGTVTRQCGAAEECA
jgi:hypothetical protein